MRATVAVTTRKRKEARVGLGKLFGKEKMLEEDAIELTLVLSEVERATLSERRLWDVRILEYEDYIAPDLRLAYPEIARQAGITHFPIRSLIGEGGRPFFLRFPNLPAAQTFAQKLKTETLPKLKQLIDTSTQGGSSETLEF